MTFSISNPTIIVVMVAGILAVIFRDKTSLLLQGLHGFANEYNSSYVDSDHEEDSSKEQ